MRGFKAFDKNLRCRDLQYTIGGEMSFDGKPVICEKGFHFCRNIADVYKYYPMSEDTRICEVEAIGDIVTEDEEKYCTNRIKILNEITDEVKKHCNSDGSTVGYCNTGNRNTGNWNTGYCNTGNCNTGNWNTGDWNTGDRNTGDCNTGNCNTGNRNTGDCNTGDWNTGDRNTGYCNTGNCNTGNRNTGDWNTGDCNTGCFCTKQQNIRFFDRDSEWTHDNWIYSRARDILWDKPSVEVEWVYSSNMTKEEKEAHPEHEATGGFLRVTDNTKMSQKWWDELPEEDKKEVMSLPNFDKKKFKECTGIEVE